MEIPVDAGQDQIKAKVFVHKGMTWKKEMKGLGRVKSMSGSQFN